MSDITKSATELERAFAASRNEWVALRDGFPELFGDPDSTELYGLPDSLLDAIEQEAPQLLSSREFEFERNLARLLTRQYSVGYIQGHLVQSSVLEERAPMIATQDDCDALGWKDFGLSCAKANLAAKTIDDGAHLFREQLIAYAGWLVTNPLFKREIAELREAELEFSIATSAEEAAPFVVAMNSFLNRWQLCRMSSWDLPEPQGPDLAGIELPEASRRSAETVILQFPLTTRLPARFPVRELVAEIRNGTSQPHLNEWHQILDLSSKSDPGLRRFSHLLHVQFFRNTVLASRYPDRIAGNVAALDRAFGRYLNVGEDSVKRFRLEITRRLNG